MIVFVYVDCERKFSNLLILLKNFILEFPFDNKDLRLEKYELLIRNQNTPASIS